LGFVLLCRDEADGVGAETLWRLLCLDVGDEAVFVALGAAGADGIDCCLFCHLMPHAAARGSARCKIFDQALAKRSISSLVVETPRLTRIALAASAGSTLIAVSTWLCRTLPDEHAEPALTAKPSRSSAITSVSAFIPDAAIQIVFGKRGASSPKI